MANDDLTEFLRPYTRLRRDDDICSMPIDQSQITAWTFRGGVWVRVSPSLDDKESWCRAYFPHDYQQVKNQLFEDTSAFNGLYKHNLADLFAIVYRPPWSGVAFFPDHQPNQVAGHVTFEAEANGVRVDAFFSQLPPGEHGFHIHKAGDLRAKGCQGACAHYHVGPPADHGGAPNARPRHTGDLGNVSGTPCRKTYELKGVDLNDLYGRSVIVHADPDDLGFGPHPDSKTTGHSGARIACAIIGRAAN